MRLTDNLSESREPSVAVSGTYVHVVWHDDRDQNWEIYYKRGATGSRGRGRRGESGRRSTEAPVCGSQSEHGAGRHPVRPSRRRRQSCWRSSMRPARWSAASRRNRSRPVRMRSVERTRRGGTSGALGRLHDPDRDGRKGDEGTGGSHQIEARLAGHPDRTSRSASMPNGFSYLGAWDFPPQRHHAVGHRPDRSGAGQWRPDRISSPGAT